MLKHYKTLEEMLIKNNFDVLNTNIIGSHLISENILNGMTYVCHFSVLNNLYTIDGCKQCTKEEAIIKAVKLITKNV